jgi:hypothetical protein
VAAEVVAAASLATAAPVATEVAVIKHQTVSDNTQVKAETAATGFAAMDIDDSFGMEADEPGGSNSGESSSDDDEEVCTNLASACDCSIIIAGYLLNTNITMLKTGGLCNSYYW